jgi:hypothetical protein
MLSVSRHITFLALLLVLSSCASTSQSSFNSLIPASSTSALEEELLDIDIAIFVPAQDATVQPVPGMNPVTIENLRYVESLYYSVYLAALIKSSDQWGIVRIIPGLSPGSDLLVTGEVVHSSGKTLDIRVQAIDATGRTWLDRNYRESLNAKYYSQADTDTVVEPFANLYTQIMEELHAFRSTLDRDDLLAIRQVAKLQFANRFAPEKFSSYLDNRQDGVVQFDRYPAVNDPVFNIINDLDMRNDFYLDLLQPQFADFVLQSLDPLSQFRVYGFFSTVNKLLGFDLSGLMSMVPLNADRTDVENTAVTGGAETELTNNERINNTPEATIENERRFLNRGTNAVSYPERFAQSVQKIELYIQPQTVELREHVFTLSGSIEDHYRQWEETLQEMYRLETGIQAAEE